MQTQRGIMLSETAEKVTAGLSPHFLLQREDETSKRDDTQLGSLFVSALSQTSESAPWESLLTYLKSQTKTELESLIERPEVQHYIHRAVHYAIKHSEKIEHLRVLDELSTLFPEAVGQYAQTKLPYSYSYTNIQISNSKRKKRNHKRAATTPVELFDYAPQNIPATFRGTQLKLTDLVPASHQVDNEISAVQRKMHHEVQRGTSRGEELREVARLGRPHVSQHGLRLKRSRSVERSMLLQASAQKPVLNPILSSSVDDAHFHKLTSETLFPQTTSPSKATARQPISSPGQVYPHDGYQTIEAFALGKFKSESESIYLNYGDPYRQKPYNLVVVSKTKADPEHFIVSKFGILHIYPDGTSDLQSFADWLREASLFQILRQIPFMRYYRLRKAFTQWYQNIRFAHFACVRSKFRRVGLRYFATFGKAVLKINNLSQELLSIPFHSLQPLGAYSSDTYLHCLKGSQVKFQQFLHRYFKYCRRIVTEVVESTQSHAVELEMELRHQPFVSDLPLSVQKEKHLQLSRDLEEISYQASRLSDFISLVEHIVSSCLVAVARQGALGWSHTTLGQSNRGWGESWSSYAYNGDQSAVTRSSSSMATSEHSANLDGKPTNAGAAGGDAMLCISIIIKESGEITTEPPVSEVKQLLVCPLDMMVQSLTGSVQPLTGVEQKVPHQCSRQSSHANSTTAMTSTEPPQSTTLESGTPLHMESSPAKKSLDVKEQISPPGPRPVPPSMVPARQPKSLLRALKGSIVAPATTAAEAKGGRGEGKQESYVLQSERARSQLATATSGDDTGALCGSVKSTRLLVKECFSATIRDDEVLMAVNASLQRAVDEACETITLMCDENQWLSDVWKFVNSWQGKSKVTSMSAEELERTFNCLYDWQCLLECLPVRQSTPHRLVNICSIEVVGRLLPRLTTILEQVKSIGVLQAKMLCERVLQQTKHKTEMLTSKRYDLEGFAEYAHHLCDCQAFHKDEAKHIDYVLRVHSTLRRNGVKVPQEDEALGEELKIAWHTFEGILREAEQFVTTQTPMKAQGLQQSIESYEDELSKFVQQVNEGKFTEPSGNPLQLLEELKLILEEAYSVRSRLLGLSKWKEAISGKPHDLSRVFRLMDQIVVRQEVWKYRKVFDGYERDWLKVPFKKLDIGLMSEKVTIWLEVCSKLEESLPPGDPVLVGWKERLWEFQQGFPLLHQLASKALKVSHWYTVFASLGEDFDPTRQYTLNDFQLYNVYEHSNIIFEICHDAMQQEKLRGKVDKMQSRLEQETLTVIQSPVDRYPFAVPSSSPLPSSQEREPRSKHHISATTSTNTTGARGVKPTKDTPIHAKKHGERITSFAIGFPPPSPSGGGVECLLFIDNGQDVLMGLENDIISVKILLASPHLGGLRSRVEAVMKTLLQLKELVGLLSQCQDQWRQLLSLFSSIDPSQFQAHGLSELQGGTAKYQEVVKSIQDDPRLLSLLGKRRGQKGFRELQGDTLRQYCNNIQAYMETVHNKIKGELERGCGQFPRLCFLGDSDILRVASHSGNPVAIMHQIQGMFPDVETVRFAEVLPSNSPGHLPHDSKEGFQVMGVEGWGREHLSLVTPLPLNKRPAPQWLHALEGALSYSLGSALAECHSTLPDSLVVAGNTEQQGDEIEQWVSSSLSQAVVLSLEMRWTGELYAALSTENPLQQLRHISSKFHAVLDTMAELLRSERAAESAIKCQLSLQNIITVLSHKLEIARSLIKKRALTPESFEWRCHVLYASDSNTIYNSIQKDRSQQGNNLSVDYNHMSMASFRGSTTSVYSSHHSLKAGSSNALVTTNAKLQGSAHSLVASSKSLLSSRNALLATAGGSDLQKSGSSSLVLFKEPQPPMKCFVHCGDSILPYGFEYHSPKAKLVLSPVSESCMLPMINELARFTVPSLEGAALSGKTETGIEVARLLGRHFYQFSCSPFHKLSTLHHVILGALQAGSLLLVHDSTSLEPHIVASLAEWLASLMAVVAKAFTGKQSSIIFPTHSHQKNISDDYSDTSSLSTPHQSRTSTSMQSRPADKTIPQNKSNLLKHTSRALSVIMSEQQLLTEPASRQGTASVAHDPQKDPTPTTKKNVVNLSEVPVPDVPYSQSPESSQHSLSHTEHRHTAPSTQPAASSQPTTRIDWYKLGEEQPSDSRSSISKSDWFGYGGGARLNLEFFDQSLQVSPGFGCIFVGTRCISTLKEIPQSFKCALRPASVVAPDCERISEALLLSYGFTEASTLSWNLSQALDTLSCQLASSSPKVASCISNVVTLKQIISRSFSIVTSKKQTGSVDIPQVESDAIAQATIHHFESQLMCEEADQVDEFEGHVSVNMDPTNWNKLNEIVSIYFPGSAITFNGADNTDGVAGIKTELVEAIKTQLKEHHFQYLPMFQEKIYQLHRSLQGSKCVVLSGISGSGKTTSYRSLAGAYHYIRELRALGKQSNNTSKKGPPHRMTGSNNTVDNSNDYPCVDITVINPAVYSLKELFGWYHQAGGPTADTAAVVDGHEQGSWRDGILTRIFKQMDTLENIKMQNKHPDIDSTVNSTQVPIELEQVNHWLVLDGPLEPGVVGALEMLVKGEGLTLPNGDTLLLPRSCWLLLETPKLTHFTPSLLSHSTMLHFSRDILSYEAIVDTWLDRAPTQHNLSAMSTETLATMIKQLLPETLNYLHETNSRCLGALYSTWVDNQVYGITETRCFVNLLSALLERNAPKVDSAFTHTGTASVSSSTRLTESRASSAMLSAYSTTSMRGVDSSFSSAMMPVESVADVHDNTLAAEHTDMADGLSECSDLEAQFNLSMQLQMASMLSFAYIWSLGAFVPFSELDSFSDFARDEIMQLPFMVPLPEEGSVFDYFLNLKQYQFIPWSQRGSEAGSKGLRSSGYVPSPEVERFSYIVDLYLSYNLDVMIVGQQGTGKTSFVENLIHSRLPVTKLQMSPTLSPAQLQEFMLERVAHLERKGSQRMVGGGRGATKLASSMRSTFFLDDIHLASTTSQTTDNSGVVGEEGTCMCSPVLELARFAVQHCHLYDVCRNYSHSLNNVRYIASCTPLEYWKLPHQLSLCFNPVPFLPPSDQCLHRVFSHSVLQWLQQFPDMATGGNPQRLAEALSAASVAMYRSVSKKFHASPSTPYHLFTMHDLMHVYEGLLLLSPTTKAQAQPQFGLMKRRGFLSSSTQSGKTPKKRSNPKLKASSRKGSVILPSLKNTESLGLRRRSTVANLPTDKGDETEIVSTTRMVIRLWCHESTRVYLDRTTDSKDRVWFLKLLESCIKYSFCGIDFMDVQKPSSQRQFGGQTGGGRRVRGGRGRVSQASSTTPSMEGPSLEELVSTGIRVDTLKQLMANEEKEEDSAEDSNGNDSKIKKLIALDQVTLRGEDLTGLIFAHFPSKSCHPTSTSASTRESISSEEGEKKITEVAEGAPQTAGTNSYSELGDGQVMEVLEKYLTSCNSDTQQQSGKNAESALHQRRDLVLFKGAIEHAARLCRVMSLPGSHSLLIGAKGSGRRSLIRLVTHIVNAKLFYLKESGHGLSNNESLRQQLRDICISAAIDGRPTVLVISSSIGIRRQDWEDIYKLMNEGLCPGLFTSSELLVMSSKMQAGRVKKTVEGAQQAFARAVGRQLHVFVLWDTNDGRTGSLFSGSVRQRPVEAMLGGELFREESSRLCFASLYRACSYIDIYQPWSKQDYCDIALSWWQREGRGSGGVKWQEWVDTSSQLEAVGNLAAHVHITTTDLLSRSYAGRISELVSPQTFIECLKMTKNLALEIKKKEQDDADKLRKALDKLNAIDNTVGELEHQLATLQPQQAMAEQEVQQKMALITAAKERYMVANQRCKFAEETIQRETDNMEQLSRMVEEKFNEVSPIYHSALEALISVQKNDILELMSYREPPDMLTPVFNALCMLFEREQTWEDCKQLLLTPKFFESLKFFDRDNVPLRKLRRLEKMINRNSKFEELDQGSQAIVPVCTWLIALVDYHYAKMAVQPYKDKLKEAEKTLMEANKTFVEMKKDMMETRTALESTVKLHKESVQKQRTIEAEITSIRSKLESARHLLSTISSQRARWDTNLNIIHDRIDSVPGHALLCAASVCYLARTPPDTHTWLLTNWLGYCSGLVSLGSLAVEHGGLQAAQGHQSYSSQQQMVKIQRDFSVSGHLSEKEEQSYWKQESIFPDHISLERCLAARSACTTGDAHWPFIFDPHKQFEGYLSALDFKIAANMGSKEVITMADSVISVKSPNAHSHYKTVLKLKLFESNFRLKLENSLQEGNTVLLCMDIECPHQTEEPSTNFKEDLAFISNVLQRKFSQTPHPCNCIIETQNGPLSVHPDFQLYLLSNKHLEDVLCQGLHCFSVFQWQLSDFCVVNIALSPEGMQSHFQRFVITHEKPEYKIRYKSLLTDLILHQQQLMESQEMVLKCVLENEDSLLQDTHLLSTVKESESLESSALEQIADTEKSMERFDKQAVAYKPLSELASIILTTIQKLSSLLKYFVFGIDKLEEIIMKLISRRKDNKVTDDVMAVNANVLHLKYQLLISIHKILQVYIFKRHQILLPFMVAVELLMRQGKMTYRECELLSADLGGLETQLDSKLREENGQQGNNIPVWISRKIWCQVLQLQRQVKTFHQLSTEISTYSAEWKEYFDAAPYLLGPVPVYFDDCTLGQKLLLWKTFQPEKLLKVCEDFVVMILGAGLSTSQSLSIDSLLPLTSPQIPILCMLPPPPPSLAYDGCTSSSPNPVALLEAAAGQMKRRLLSFALLNRENSDELLVELTQLACEDCWVLVQHCHLYSKWQQVLQHIIQLLCEFNGEERIHPDFRMWIFLPFDATDSDLSIDCFKVAFDYSGTKMRVLQSKELSSDLKLLYPSQSSTRGKWEEYNPLLLKLLSFIPPTLPYSKLTELNPQQETTQSLPSLLYEELCVHNSSLMQLQALLSELFSFSSGNTLFTSNTGLALKSIRDNTIPIAWKSLFPFPLGQCPELVPALNLLKYRIDYYTRALESGCLHLPAEVEPYLFSNPQDMIWRVLHKYSSGSQIDVNLIIDDFPVHQNTDGNVPSIILPNMCLHGAGWDKQTTQLTPLGDNGNTRGTRCSVILTPKPPHSENTTTTMSYDCPVLLVTSGSLREPTVLQSAPQLCTVPLPCSKWEQLMSRTHKLPSQEGDHSAALQLNEGDYCRPAVFLTCEWPT